MENKSIYELVMRLNQLMVERYNLDIEHNKIVEELHRRMPHLKDDKNLELVKIKKYGKR